MSSEETSSHADGASFSLNVGDDLLAEALAAVERREGEARARRRPADPDEMEAFAADLSLDEPGDDAPGEHEDEAEDLAVELEFDDSFELESEEEEDDPVVAEASSRDDQDADGNSLEPPTEAELGLGEGAHSALLRELTRLQARVAELGQEREEALDQAARFEERLLEHEAAQHELQTELEETQLRLRKYRAARKRQLEEARRSQAALARARERASRADDRAATAEAARDETASSLREALSRLGEAERAVEHAHQRRRRELADQKRTVAERCWKAILPVLDNLQLALSHAEGDPALVVEGVRMVERQAVGVLASGGVTPVDASCGQPFNPAVHEAVERTETEDVEPDAIVGLLQAGYQLDGRLLRPARVSVAAPPATSDPPPAAKEAATDAGHEVEAETAMISHAAPDTATESDHADAPTSVVPPVAASHVPGDESSPHGGLPTPCEPGTAGPAPAEELHTAPAPVGPDATQVASQAPLEDSQAPLEDPSEDPSEDPAEDHPEPATEQPAAASVPAPAPEPAPSAPDSASTTAPSD